MPWRHNGLNKFSFLLFHQLHWSYIQNSFCKSFKITAFYKNSSQFSSLHKYLTQGAIFTNTYVFLQQYFNKENKSLYIPQQILCSFSPSTQPSLHISYHSMSIICNKPNYNLPLLLIFHYYWHSQCEEFFGFFSNISQSERIYIFSIEVVI